MIFLAVSNATGFLGRGICLFLSILTLTTFSPSQQVFRFAHVTDTHVGNATAGEDLGRTVRDINATKDIVFTIISGDITEMGSNAELELAKSILDSLAKPYYIIPGNHDTKWSESGCTKFSRLWKDDKFTFEYGGVRFLGCSSGPNMRMGDGHVPPEDIRWVDSILVSLRDRNQPLIFVNHYPLDAGLDNWYELTDRLKKRNTLAVLCGHGHANRAMTFEGIPGTMGRSNLRANNPVGGYNIIEVTSDTIFFSERTPGIETKPAWRKIPTTHPNYARDTATYARPDYSMNREYPDVAAVWVTETGYSIGSTPAVWNELVIVGNASGSINAFNVTDGKAKWTFRTNGSVYSSPETAEQKVVVGSSDGNIYCLNASTGMLIWKVATGNAVVASPTILDGVVYIGGSDGMFRALRLSSGAVIWSYTAVEGFVESKPLAEEGRIIFGAWDTYLYSLDLSNGTLLWKWSNGKSGRLLSPAACVPVASSGKIFIVAPDRYMTALGSRTGQALWRSGTYRVREMIGISEDRSRVYARLMNDSVLAFSASAASPELTWATNCKYGYDIDPSSPVEKNGTVFFGTKNGLVYALDAATGNIRWRFKFGNTIINTVRPLSDRKVLVTSMDGKIALIESKK
jgi:outer membrane protein assembly factor BamB/Icc-related predicted phosphoesterase